MSKFRKVSSSNFDEAGEVQVAGAVLNPDATYSITLGDVSAWPAEVDFITYGRDVESKVDEKTRVVWYGNKIDDTTIKASRVGGQTGYVPGPTNFATVVPTHYWANQMVEGISASVPADGAGGIVPVSGNPVMFSVGATPPSAIAGRTVVWLKPLE